MDLRRRESRLVLRREVEEAPERSCGTAGLGVMLVASMAMFFAIAGSAFMLRARMVAERCPHAMPPTAVVAPAAPSAPTETIPVEIVRCGEALYGPNGEVTYIACEPSAPDSNATPIGSPKLAVPQ